MGDVPGSPADTVALERVTTITQELVEAVQRLYPQLTHGAIPDAEALARVVRGGGTFLFVARCEGSIVGMGTLVVYTVLTGTAAHVEDLVVDTRYRGRGIGERLMRELMSQARAGGAGEIALTSHPTREAANRLYQRLGFELGGTNYYLLDLG